MLPLLLLLPIAAGGADGSCVPATDELLRRRQVEAAERTEASFQEALRARGLRVISLGRHERTVAQGYAAAAAALPRPPTVVHARLEEGRVEGDFLVGPRYWTGDHGSRSLRAPEVAVDRSGHLFVIDRAPAVQAEHVAACGCRPVPRTPCGSPCTGCGEVIEELYGPLPSRAFFAGVLKLPYPAWEVVPRFEGTCAPPPPSPCPG